MHWILCTWLILTFFAQAKGHNTLYEGYDLSLSGYHLCSVTDSVPVTNVVSSKTPYTQMRPCGGWLPWKTCNVTLYTTTYETQIVYIEKRVKRCCEGYEQVGSYCALGLNRSQEFTCKPGGCPTRPAPTSALVFECKWDTDCLGWQKCCQTGNLAQCVDPLPVRNEGWWLNATVTVKAAYHLVNTRSGILNHTRLLHSLVTGSLTSTSISVHHTRSWPAGQFTTASSLLIGSSEALSSTDTFNRLQLLLETIEEVTAVDVNDVDECSIPVLRTCSPLATCANTHGSHYCTCPAGSVDLDPSRPGTVCRSACTQFDPICNVLSSGPLLKPPQSSVTTTTQPSTTASTQTSTSTSSTSTNSSSTQTSAVTGPPVCTTNQYSKGTAGNMDLNVHFSNKRIPQITNLKSYNVTASSFRLSWHFPPHIGLVSHLIILKGSSIWNFSETALSDVEASGLQCGVLYTVRVSLCACGHCGNVSELRVKPEGKTLKAVTRLTNINFVKALGSSNSEEFRNLSKSILSETLRSLPQSILQMVHSGKVLVLITKLSPGSVVADISLVFLPDVTEDIVEVAYAMIASLKNSSVYTLDMNFTSVEDVDECSLGEADCSPWAVCNNTFGSYTCACQSGYTDANPTRPGRTCTESDSAQSSNITPPQSDHDAVTLSTTTAIAPITAENLVVSSSSTEVSTTTTATVPVMANKVPEIEFNLITTQSTETTAVAQTSLPTTVTTTSRTSTTMNTVPVAHASPPLLSYNEAIRVECSPGSVAVLVAKDFLQLRSISEAALYLGMANCAQTESNSSYVRLIVAWGECGSTIVRYANWNTTVQVTLYNNVSIWRTGTPPTVKLEVPIICTYIHSLTISTGDAPSGYLDMIDDPVIGSGTFHVNFRLLKGTSPLPQNYTLSPADEVIVEVQVNSSLPQIKVVINKCWANPSNIPTDLPQFVFLENSCPKPSAYTTVLQNGNSSKSLVAVNIFSLVDLSIIYLHCQIQICIETSTATCRPSCLSRNARTSNVIGMAKASCGPLLKPHTLSLQEAALDTRTTGFILLGVGLFVFLLIGLSAFSYYRKRIGKYNFHFKPRQEKFTYHVFDT